MRVPSLASIGFLLVRGFLCQGQDTTSINPCCHFPCQNWGVCVRFGEERYECDCTRTGYYGENCTIPEFWSRVQQLLKPSPDVVHYILTHFKWLWDIINQTFLRNMLIRLVLQVRSSLIPSPPTYNSKYGYLSWESYSNATYYTRILPPVPEDCPTPMGVKGKAVLPDPEILVEKFLLRKKFRPDPQGTNLMFAFFAQHFTHQFFKTHNRVGLGFTKALGHGENYFFEDFCLWVWDFPLIPFCERLAELNDTFSDANNDTVGQIVHYIMKNQANTDALTAMVAENSVECDRPNTPTSPVSPSEGNAPLSPGAPPGAPKHTCSHLHTVGGVVGQKSICSRCNQKKWPLVRRPSRGRSPGQVTVLSVGRFRVTKCDPKNTRERRSLHTSDPNGSVPSSPTAPKSRTSSDSQEKQDKGPI